MDYFVYNGLDSRDFGVYVGRTNNKPLITHHSPPSISTTEKITGWHGEFFIEQVYGARKIDVEIYLVDLSDNMMKKISAWLKKTGIYEIYFNNESYKVYYGTIEDEFDISKFNFKQATGKLSFVCYNPFGYSSFTAQDAQNTEYNTGLQYNTGIPYVDSSLLEYSFTSSDLPNLDIYHGGNTNLALPKITIDGSASTITIGRYSDSARTELVQECTYGSFNGTLLIDSERRDTFLDGDLSNATFEGDYFTLDGADELYFDVTGEIQSNTTTTIVLDDNASSVNDIYNEKLIVIQNGIVGETQYRKVNDYVGSTKTVVIDSITGDLSNYKYVIYDIQNGMNYFKITGTSMSITSIDFDFKYVFL